MQTVHIHIYVRNENSLRISSIQQTSADPLLARDVDAATRGTRSDSKKNVRRKNILVPKITFRATSAALQIRSFPLVKVSIRVDKRSRDTVRENSLKSFSNFLYKRTRKILWTFETNIQSSARWCDVKCSNVRYICIYDVISIAKIRNKNIYKIIRLIKYLNFW